MDNMRNIHDVARYLGISLLLKGLSVSPLKLQKILYYTQSWYMVFFGRENSLFKENPQAWVNGPVYPEIYSEYKGKVNGMCDHLQAKDFDCTEENLTDEANKLAKQMNFTDDDVECIDSILTLYGAKTQNQLVLLTHTESPWVDARKGLLPFDYSKREIALDTMYTYYKTRHDKVRNGK